MTMIWTNVKRLLRPFVSGSLQLIIAAMAFRLRKRRGVLVVRLDAIGDFVLWQSSARHLRDIYPDQRITLAINALCAPLAQRLSYWDDVVPVDVSRLQKDRLYRFRQLCTFARGGFDVCIQPTYSRAFKTGDKIVRASHARLRVGLDGDTVNISTAERRISDTWYTELLYAGEADLTEIEHNERFMNALAGRTLNARPYVLPTMGSLPEPLSFDRPYFIVFPGASWSGRQWPEQAFADLIDHTFERFGLMPMLCGSGSEADLCRRIALRASCSTTNLAGKTSLPEFCELVRGARLLIGNETSAVHIAAAVGTPSICLLGGGHFGRFVPYPPTYRGSPPIAVFESMKCFGCNWNCHLPFMAGDAVPCVAAIKLAPVKQVIERLLGGALKSLV